MRLRCISDVVAEMVKTSSNYGKLNLLMLFFSLYLSRTLTFGVLRMIELPDHNLHFFLAHPRLDRGKYFFLTLVTVMLEVRIEYRISLFFYKFWSSPLLCGLKKSHNILMHIEL